MPRRSARPPRAWRQRHTSRLPCLRARPRDVRRRKPGRLMSCGGPRLDVGVKINRRLLGRGKGDQGAKGEGKVLPLPLRPLWIRNRRGRRKRTGPAGFDPPVGVGGQRWGARKGPGGGKSTSPPPGPIGPRNYYGSLVRGDRRFGGRRGAGGGLIRFRWSRQPFAVPGQSPVRPPWQCATPQQH